MLKRTEHFYKNKPIFDLAGDVKEICNPFFKQLGINYFDYIRFYPDNTFVGLVSDGDWVEHFFKRRYAVGCTLKNSGIHLWSAYHSSELIQEAREYFSHDFGVSMFNKTPEYIEYFDFATESNNRQIISTYYNTDALQKCSEYFKENALHLINKASKDPIYIPQTMQGNLIPENNFVSGKSQELTSRQLQCAVLLVKGFTIKEIGKILQLSARTVEHYIENIKIKFQCSKKYELISYLLKLNAVKNRI